MNIKKCKRLWLLNRLVFSFLIIGLLGFTSATALAQVVVKVSTLAELREAVQESDQHIIMQPGCYTITELPRASRNFPCSGDNNLIEMTGVYISFPVGEVDGAYFRLSGNHITLKGGEYEDIYKNGMTEVADFGSYNQDRKHLAKGQKGGALITVPGNHNRVEGIKLTARGSFPYGYGNMYGIGGKNAAGLDKRCGLLIHGQDVTVEGCEFQHRAFGHVIYMGKDFDDVLIKDCLIEGAVRSSNDVYLEMNEDGLPKRFDYKVFFDVLEGLPIPRDKMLNLTEDGIRAYPGHGDVTVENCTIRKCRAGIKLYMTSGKAIARNCTVLDCIVEGYSMPSDGEVINCRGNAAYGPLIYIHPADNFYKVEAAHRSTIELELLPSPHAVGNHVMAAIRGTDNVFKLTQAESPVDAVLRPIVVGYYSRFELLTTDFPGVPEGYEANYEKYKVDYEAAGNTIINETEYPVILGERAEQNKVTSFGAVTDYGKSNEIVQLDKLPAQAVHGLVADADGLPLDGVLISCDGEAVKTNADGRFAWNPSKKTAGEIQLRIEKLGYEPQTITVQPENRNPLSIQLVSTGDPLAAYTISKVQVEPEALAMIAEKWGDEFKHVDYPQQVLDTIITLKPGDDIQAAIDVAHQAGGGVVFLTEGAYETGTLKLQSKVTLCGAGRDKTIVTHTGEKSFMEQGAKKLTDVIFKDLTFKGGKNTGSGLNLRGDNDDRHDRFMWQNVTVKNMGSHGIGISRVNNIIMDNSVFQHNGTKGGLHHNVYFLFVGQVLQSDCDMSYPTEGKSNKYTSTKYLLTQRCVMKDGKQNGIQADNDQGGYLFFHKHHLSGFDKVAMWFPCEAYYDKFTYTEDPKWVPQHVILNRCEVIDNTWGAMWRIVNGSYVINSMFDNEKIDMGLLKCGIRMQGSTFVNGNEYYSDVEQWPEDVELLW
ncbi:right-handed parallel beta-helix repeat-containing protein [Pontiellaceae bacterium B1224]|nr:right-handed parallel beta-helix repeat-containing protein [Pontiellaceae bacterium B1224]